MNANDTTSDQWWVDFHVAEMADLFLEREDQDELQSTIDFLVDKLGLSPGDRVFDQCCGIGNISHRLALNGAYCVGVDLCRLYIDRAKSVTHERDLPCEFFCDDAYSFVAPSPCEGAFNWYSSFGYAASDDQNSQMAARAFESLKPGGVYALDVPNFPFLMRNFQRYMVRHGKNHEGRKVTCIRESDLDLYQGVLRQSWQWIVEGRPIDTRYSALRIYLPHQLIDMLRAVGFTDVRAFGNLNDAELTMDSPRLILTARRPE